jgi:carboxyl-terminal processing protease
LSRQKSPWPKNEAEADQLWRGRIANELLQEHLSEHPIEPAPQLVSRRYERLAKNVHEQDKDEQMKLYLDALAQAYDPHSEYLSKAGHEKFQHQHGPVARGHRRHASLRDGYAKIESLVPGGPAQTDGGSRSATASLQWRRGRRNMSMFARCDSTKVVEMIRGKKGTRVRLLVIPSDATDPSRRKNVELVRDEIKLKDQEARADIIIKKDENGDPIKLGWLTLPSFYADMDRHQKSTTRDVLALLKRLKKENIAGLVVDLRKNGGGSLEEALSLTGLFLKSGPIVQTKDYNGRSGFRPIRIRASLTPGRWLFLPAGKVRRRARFSPLRFRIMAARSSSATRTRSAKALCRRSFRLAGSLRCWAVIPMKTAR